MLHTAYILFISATVGGLGNEQDDLIAYALAVSYALVLAYRCSCKSRSVFCALSAALPHVRSLCFCRWY